MLTPLEPFGAVLEIKSLEELQALTGTKLLEVLKEHYLVVIRGLRTLTPLELRSFALSFPGSQLVKWETGEMMEMKPSSDPKNYLFSRERVPFHWDGAFHQVPDFLVFQCILAPDSSSGGETLFSNAVQMSGALTEKEKKVYQNIQLTYQTEKLAHYGGKFTTPLIAKHPLYGIDMLRFAEEVETELNPVSLKVEGVEDKGQFINRLTEKIYSPQFCYEHVWQKGDLLIADNHALLHGRKRFTSECERHLRRIQVRIPHAASH